MIPARRTTQGLALVLAALAVVGCGGDSAVRGLGEPAGFDIADTDRIEVRAVLPTEAEAAAEPEADRHPTPFGMAAVLIGTLDDEDEFNALIAAVEQASYIDTGNVVYDLSNPDYDVVFLQGGTTLAHLGYYEQIGSWGQFEVPGRWMDEAWSLLAIAHELPEEATTPRS